MYRKEIIEALNLIYSVNPSYTSARRKNLEDSYTDMITANSISEAIDLLEKDTKLKEENENIQARLDYTKAKLDMAEEEKEEIEKENKELKELNQKLMVMAFPEATKHFKEMVGSIIKTIKESGLNE